MGLASSEWVFDRVGRNTTPDQGAIHAEICESRMSEFDCRSGENASKGSDRDVITGDRPVCGTFVPEAKERWVTAACVQSENPQCLRKTPSFQDGRHSNCIRSDSEQRLAGRIRMARNNRYKILTCWNWRVHSMPWRLSWSRWQLSGQLLEVT